VNYFPQTGAGSVAQFPLQRTRQWRRVSNRLESGEMIMLPDAPASRIAWGLKYTDVTAAESAKFSALFATCYGQYGAFLFVDPMANLLAWSEDYTRPNWQPGLLNTSPGAADPIGTTRASTIVNPAKGEQPLIQTLDLPGDYVACLSVWARSDSGAAFALTRDGLRLNVALTPGWTRYNISGTGTAGAASSTFSVVVGAGQTAQIFGAQVEAQPAASAYKQTSTPMGIYPETYFAADELSMTSTGPGLFAFDIDLISRVQS
jgi:hypothetical protein